MKQTRRQLLGSMIAGCAMAGGLTRAITASSAIQLPGIGTTPQGTQLAGPLGLNPAGLQLEAKGEIPVAITIPAADVDAEVERTKIVDGQMLDPSGPWIVAWYEGTGLVGEINNAVMSGHVDYWDVGPAVLRNVANLSQGAEMTVLGIDGGSYVYALEKTERVEVATLTQEKIKEIVGPTDYAALTIITCGGRFNYDAGEYYERDILRARLVSEQSGTGDESAGAITSEEAAPSKPQGLTEGASAVIVSNVNLRPDASTIGDPLIVLDAGEEVTITGDSVDAEGYTWWPVTTADGTAGWVAADFLEPAG